MSELNKLLIKELESLLENSQWKSNVPNEDIEKRIAELKKEIK